MASQPDDGEIFWERFWSTVRLDGYVSKLTLHDRLLIEKLVSWIGQVGAPPERTIKRVLEIGCAYSKNLFMIPPLAGENVFFLGLDSCKGPTLETGRGNPHSSVSLIVGDLFNSPVREKSLEMIISFGLIEHYRSAREFLAACFRMLAPGGRLVAGYPSFTGLSGWLQRAVNPRALEYHFSLPCSEIAPQLTSCGFTEVQAVYFGLFNPNMIDWGEGRFSRLLMYSAFAAVRPLEWLAGARGAAFSSERFSSYVLATGIKPEPAPEDH